MCGQSRRYYRPAALLWILTLIPSGLSHENARFQLNTTPAAERVRTEIPYRDGKVVLLSDFQERISKTRYLAKGNVDVTFQDIVLTSDEVEYDEETRQGFTRGTTRFSQGKQWFTCSRAEFDFSNQTGTFYDASGFTDREILIKGRTIIKTGRDTYHVQGSLITACQERRPKWALGASRTNLRVDHTARMRRVIFKIKGVPVVYLPYLIFPMEKKERSSGLVPFHYGNSTSKGRVFSEGYYQTLGQSADATIYGDYFSLRGLGVGGIFRARPSPQTRFYLQAYGINDKLGQGGALLLVDGESLLSHDFRAVARINLTSNFLFRQAFSDSFKAATIPQDTSTIFLTRNVDSYSTNISVQRDEVVFPVRSLVIGKVPSIEFSSLGQPLGNTPFIFYLDSSLAGFSRTDAVIETPKLVQRLDFYPRMAVRLPAIAGFSLIPTVGLRETYYGASLTGGPNPEASPKNLNRQYAEFVLDLRTPTLEREFDVSWLGKFKHVVEPVVTYRRIYGVKHLDETIRFDDLDPIADTNEVEYGIVNRIFRSREVKPGVKQEFEFLSISLTQKYYFDPTFGGALHPGESNDFYPLYTLTGFASTGTLRNLAPTNLVARISPMPTITYDIRADFDTRVQRLRDASLSAYWQKGRVYTAGTYFKVQALEPGTFDSHQVQWQFGYGSPLRGFSASLAFSYNILSATLLTSHSRVNYMWDCCGLSMEFQQFDLGLRTESRLNFSFTLKGVGSFGNIKRPESLF